MKKNVYLVRVYDKDSNILTFERFTYTHHRHAVNAIKKLLSDSLYRACLGGKPHLYVVLLDNEFDGMGDMVDSGFCEGV